jgi:hypothetical protein
MTTAYRRSSRCAYVDVEFELGSVTRSDISLIPECPQHLKEFGFAILVLKVVGVFPRIDDHQWNAGLGEVRLVIVNLRDQKPFSSRLPHQRDDMTNNDVKKHHELIRLSLLKIPSGLELLNLQIVAVYRLIDSLLAELRGQAAKTGEKLWLHHYFVTSLFVTSAMEG